MQMASNANARKFYGDTAWEYWDPMAKSGMQLALMRLVQDLGPLLSDYETFLRSGDDWPMKLADYHGEACSDLADLMGEHQSIDPAKALQMKVYSEFFAQK